MKSDEDINLDILNDRLKKLENSTPSAFNECYTWIKSIAELVGDDRIVEEYQKMKKMVNSPENIQNQVWVIILSLSRAIRKRPSTNAVMFALSLLCLKIIP